MSKIALKPLTESSTIYARPNGWAYHLDRNCTMLEGGQFEHYQYTKITPEDINHRHLVPCVCAYNNALRKGGNIQNER